MKLVKSDVGRLCLVKWDDIGRIECMLLEIDRGNKEAKVYSFVNESIEGVPFGQIVELGGSVTPNTLLESQVGK